MVRLLTGLTALLLGGAILEAKGATAPEISLSGRLNLELASTDRFYGGDIHKEAVLQLETKRAAGVKGVVDFKISSDSGQPNLRELYLDHKTEGGNRWIVGQARKRLGLGWERGMEERLGLTRGAVYRKLGDLSFAGRDTTIGFRSAPSDSGWRHDLSLHTSEGMNAAVLYRGERETSATARWISYTLVQGGSVDSRWELSWAQGFAYESRHQDTRFEVEAFVGKDAVESAYEGRAGRGGQVLFSSVSVSASRKWAWIEPYARHAWLVHDLSRWSRRTLELTTGARFHVRPRFIVGAELALLRSAYDGRGGYTSDTGVLASMRYFL